MFLCFVSPAPSPHPCLLCLKATGDSLLHQPQNNQEMSNCHTGAGGAEGKEGGRSGGQGWVAEAILGCPCENLVPCEKSKCLGFKPSEGSILLLTRRPFKLTFQVHALGKHTVDSDLTSLECGIQVFRGTVQCVSLSQ